MASNTNLMKIEQPWAFRPTFTDAWISDMYTKETDTLTKALQMSFAATSDGDAAFSPAEMVDSLFVKKDMAQIQTPTASGCSENENAAAVSKPRRAVPSIGGRISKRKSRASKRSTTTFITADAANFRQMVQQVTGVRFAGLNGGVPAPVLKPESHRGANWIQMGGGLPTFDPSAFLLDGSGSTMVAQPITAATVGADGNGIDFDTLCSFPTLESYVVN